MPRDDSSDSDAAPARRAPPSRRKSSDEEDQPGRRRDDMRERLAARRAAAESSSDSDSDEARQKRAGADARERLDAEKDGLDKGLTARELARERVLARRRAKNDSDGDVEMTGEKPRDPTVRGNGRERAREREAIVQRAADADATPKSPVDEETGLSAREKARRRVMERRRLREAQAQNEAKSDGEEEEQAKPQPDQGLLDDDPHKDGDGTKMVRRPTILRWADGASVFAMLAFITCFSGFFGLCLVDNQCIVHYDDKQNDPAILEESYAARGLIWALFVCGFFVVPYVLVATDSARRIRVLRVAGEAAQKRNPQHWYYDRKYLWQAVVLALITSLCLMAAASERSTKIRHQYKSVQRNWAHCQEEAAANGVWVARGDCPWTNDVRLFYKPEEGDAVEARGRPATIYRDRGESYDVDYLDGDLEREEHLHRREVLHNEAGAIRRKRRRFLEHQVIVAATEAACLMASALCLAMSYLAAAGGAWGGDSLRLKPRLRSGN